MLVKFVYLKSIATLSEAIPSEIRCLKEEIQPLQHFFPEPYSFAVTESVVSSCQVVLITLSGAFFLMHTIQKTLDPTQIAQINELRSLNEF